MSQGVVTFFNPLKVPITQFITTHRAHPAGDCAGSWIYLCEQNLGLARKELTGQSANKEEPLRWHIYTSNDSFCLQLHLDNFFFIFKYFFDCVESSFLCLDFSLVVANGGYSPDVVNGLLIAVASPIVEHGTLGCAGFNSRGMWAQ